MPQQITNQVAVVAALLSYCLLAAGTDINGRAFSSRQAKLAATLTSARRAPVPQTAQPLEAGKALKQEIAGGQTHTYQITLAAQQYLRVVVDERYINLTFTIFGPDGAQIVEANDKTSSDAEEAALIAAQSGVYELKLRPTQEGSLRRSYEIKLAELRPAVAQDQTSLALQQAFREARALMAQATPEARRKAIERLQEARLLARELQDQRGEGAALGRIGVAYSVLGERQQALDFHQQSLAVLRAAGERFQEAQALTGIAQVYDKLGEQRQVIDFYQQATAVAHSAGNLYDEAWGLLILGGKYQERGEYQSALEAWNRALPVFRAMAAPPVSILNDLGRLYTRLGETWQALDYFDQMLQVLPASREYAAMRCNVLTNVGFLYNSRGNAPSALEHFQNARAACLASRNAEEGLAVTGIGAAYAEMGEEKKALEYYEQALVINRAKGDRRGEGIALSAMGAAYDALGDKPQALKFLSDGLALIRASSEPLFEVTVLNRTGLIYDSLDEGQKALEAYKQSLPLSQKIGDRNGEAAALMGLARVARNRGNIDEARTQTEAALNLIELLRTKIAGPSLRASYFATASQYYEFYVELLMQMHARRPAEGFAAAALQASERARARSLLEMLAESGAEIREGVDAALLDRERRLQQLLNAKTDELMHTPALLKGKAEKLQKEMQTLLVEYQQVQTQIRAVSPRYAALTQPQPLSARAIQQELDADTLLLEYALGDERSYLWAVTKDSLQAYELPGRNEIEPAARRVYSLLTARQPVAGETEAQWRKRVAEADTKYWPEAAALSRMLLGPVAAQLSNQRLAIVATGALQYVPFAALPEPVAGGRWPVIGGDKPETNHAPSNQVTTQPDRPPATDHQPPTTNHQPLIINHEIINLPSASALAVQRHLLTGRAPASKTLVVVADPVFEKDDPRLKRQPPPAAPQPASDQTSVPPRGSQAWLRALRDPGDGRAEAPFSRLLYSRTEANRILALVEDAGQKLAALDFAASRTTALGIELGQYRYLHLATHGLLNETHPELSGVVLSLFDEQGRPQDGFLKLHEIYNLKLAAELVVLSACQTGLGKQIKGEGIIGLTRGFMHAGAPRVVASLWKVQDDATAELMSEFYRVMLRTGKRPAEALRAAQLTLMNRPARRAPFYWAAFSLQGEWR